MTKENSKANQETNSTTYAKNINTAGSYKTNKQKSNILENIMNRQFTYKWPVNRQKAVYPLLYKDSKLKQ